MSGCVGSCPGTVLRNPHTPLQVVLVTGRVRPALALCVVMAPVLLTHRTDAINCCNAGRCLTAGKVFYYYFCFTIIIIISSRPQLYFLLIILINLYFPSGSGVA